MTCICRGRDRWYTQSVASSRARDYMSHSTGHCHPLANRTLGVAQLEPPFLRYPYITVMSRRNVDFS